MKQTKDAERLDRLFETQALKEVNALVPSEKIYDLKPKKKPRRRIWPWILTGACSSVAILLAMHSPIIIALAPISFSLSQPRCTFADGTSEPGTCVLVADFYNRADGASLFPFAPHSDYDGPLQGFSPNTACFRASQVTQSGGAMVLSVTPNSRPGGCPATWTATTAYNSTACGGSGCATNWPVNQATSYDVGYADVPTFQGLYGHITMVFTASGGAGPGTDFSLWGVNCQSSTGVVGQLVQGLFTLAGPCTWPASGSQEMDLYQFAHANGNQNSSMYRAAGQGAPSMSTFFGTPYYGMVNTNQANVPFAAATLFSPNTTPADPTTGVHVAEVEWEPGLYWFKLDGLQIAQQSAAWIEAEAKFPMVWNAMTTTPSGGSFPPLKVYSFHWVCPPGVPCRWTGP